jgi:hypothetical protein
MRRCIVSSCSSDSVHACMHCIALHVFGYTFGHAEIHVNSAPHPPHTHTPLPHAPSGFPPPLSQCSPLPPSSPRPSAGPTLAPPPSRPTSMIDGRTDKRPITDRCRRRALLASPSRKVKARERRLLGLRVMGTAGGGWWRGRAGWVVVEGAGACGEGRREGRR